MSTIPVERAETSVELGERAAAGAERRMLIDGELVEAASGALFDNASPATGAVLGVTAAAGAHDMERAIAAARAAFDSTDWSTNPALRKRCLDQLQCRAGGRKRGTARPNSSPRSGAPVMTTQTAQLEWPLAESLRYPARLIDDFEWERVLDGGGLFGERNVRTVVKEAVGVVAAVAPSNFPIEVVLNKLGPALAAGNTVVLKPDPQHAVERHQAGADHRRAHRHPARRGQRGDHPVERRRRAAGHRPARRPRVVHRFHRGGQAADAPRRRLDETDVPRTRRQVGGHRARRREPGGHRADSGRGVRPCRAGVRGDQPDADPPVTLRAGGGRHHHRVSACARG